MNKNKLIRNESKIFKVVVCSISSILVKLFLILMAAIIISKNDIVPEILYLFWFVIAAISAFISGFAAGKIFRSKGFLWGAISGCSGALILILLLLVYSQFNFDFMIFMILPIEILTGSIGGIISSNLKQ